MKKNKLGNEVRYTTKDEIFKYANVDGWVLNYASDDLRDDKDLTLEFVSIQGWNLNYVLKKFKNDKEVVLEAVKRDGHALGYASKTLQNDKDVILAAVKQNGLALKYASDRFKNNEEVVLNAITQNKKNLSFLYSNYISSEFKYKYKYIMFSNMSEKKLKESIENILQEKNNKYKKRKEKKILNDEELFFEAIDYFKYYGMSTTYNGYCLSFKSDKSKKKQLELKYGTTKEEFISNHEKEFNNRINNFSNKNEKYDFIVKYINRITLNKNMNPMDKKYFNIIFNILTNKNTKDSSTVKEKIEVITEVVNLIDYILKNLTLKEKNRVVLYILLRYCLPYTYQSGRNSFLNREYQPLFFASSFFNTDKEDNIKDKYFYDDGNNPVRYKFNKKDWKEYKQKLFSFIEKI